MEQQYTLREVRTGQVHPVPPQGACIGREPPSDIVLPDESVSRQHATVWIQAGRLYIRDEGSTNGTWVNERRITGPTPLRRGDRVRLGYTVLEVVATGPGMTVAIPSAEVPSAVLVPGVPPAVPAPGVPPAVPARRQPKKVRPLVLIGLGVLILCGVLALAIGLWAVGGQRGALPFFRPTPTPTSTPTPIPGIERPVQIEGTEVTFTRAEKTNQFRNILGEVIRPTSLLDSLLVVDAEMPPAQYDWDKVSEWDIILNEDIEPSIIQGTEGGAVTWVFVVRKAETSFVLKLPDGTRVDLAPILR